MTEKKLIQELKYRISHHEWKESLDNYYVISKKCANAAIQFAESSTKELKGEVKKWREEALMLQSQVSELKEKLEAAKDDFTATEFEMDIALQALHEIVDNNDDTSFGIASEALKKINT